MPFITGVLPFSPSSFAFAFIDGGIEHGVNPAPIRPASPVIMIEIHRRRSAIDSIYHFLVPPFLIGRLRFPSKRWGWVSAETVLCLTWLR
jgi:hypothetical protein